ncbi:MAG: undecaprenyl/decaprenyl-phosphate alpha-N-acetylglucosaminyl 1-phosphate transferase, partial [Bacteroidales bacterium]|nr:undecaprenyl/decaprenyl-phosphate alpha-N-acetylglucosaminyl 1-phosphate transferase [Bacteroidales bacterium]
IINGFNLIDGIDGLASGIAMLVSLVFGIWFFLFGMDTYGIMSFAFIGALLAFFRYNVYGRKNRIFLGDTGSMIIGFMIAVFAINYMEYGVEYPASFGAHASPAIAFSILILPLFDTLRVFTLRIRAGTSPFNADRRHLHHMLLELGLNHIQATSLLIGVNVFFILLAFSLQQMGNLFLIALTLTLATSFSYLLWVLQTRKRNSFEYKYKILREEMFTNIYSLNNRGSQVLTKVS